MFFFRSLSPPHLPRKPGTTHTLPPWWKTRRALPCGQPCSAPTLRQDSGRVATLPCSVAEVRCPSLCAPINTERREKRGGKERKPRGAKFWRKREGQWQRGKKRNRIEKENKPGVGKKIFKTDKRNREDQKQRTMLRREGEPPAKQLPQFPYRHQHRELSAAQPQQREEGVVDRGRNTEQRRRTAAEPPSQQLPLGFPATVRSPSRCQRHQQIIKEEQKHRGKLR